MDSEKRAELVDIARQLVSLLSEEERNQILAKKPEEHKGIPVSIFRTELSGLEAVTVYLRDIRGLSTKDAAGILNRNISTIYTTYNNAKKKLKKALDISDYSIEIPLEIFSDRKFSILESLISYLKDRQGMTLARISDVLQKNYSTIKTTYRRYMDKCAAGRSRADPSGGSRGAEHGKKKR